MNIQVLPNWFKKIAIIIFVVSTILSGADDFIAGYKEGYNKERTNSSMYEKYIISDHNNYYFTNMIGGKKVAHGLGILASLALLAYLFSKEKIEDDYIKLLRLEAFQLSFIIITLFALIFYIFEKEFLFGIGDSVNFFMFLYLLIFYFKKRFV